MRSRVHRSSPMMRCDIITASSGLNPDLTLHLARLAESDSCRRTSAAPSCATSAPRAPAAVQNCWRACRTSASGRWRRGSSTWSSPTGT